VIRYLCAAALLAMHGAALADERPEEAATRFYSAYQKLRAAGLSGLPDGKTLRRLVPLLTPELARNFEAAIREQQRCAKKFPDDKPPWAEGDMFSSNFEGFTSFKPELGKGAGASGQVAVAFEYAEGNDRVEWRDMLVLKNAGGHWRIDNVVYRAPFQFTSGYGADLRSSLMAIPACGG
jgi:hypothetical protein